MGSSGVSKPKSNMLGQVKKFIPYPSPSVHTSTKGKCDAGVSIVHPMVAASIGSPDFQKVYDKYIGHDQHVGVIHGELPDKN